MKNIDRIITGGRNNRTESKAEFNKRGRWRHAIAPAITGYTNLLKFRVPWREAGNEQRFWMVGIDHPHPVANLNVIPFNGLGLFA